MIITNEISWGWSARSPRPAPAGRRASRARADERVEQSESEPCVESQECCVRGREGFVKPKWQIDSKLKRLEKLRRRQQNPNLRPHMDIDRGESIVVWNND